jgi:peptidoglycan L-alanyl-D-glutamate endopeptidase CwlK
MSRNLDDLAPAFKPLAFELIARCACAGIPLVVIYTQRTPEEQASLIAAGRSWTQQSRHLVGMAIDVCPYLTYQMRGANKLEWDANDPVWQQIGAIGEKLGLRWGGRWQQKDMGHFEIPAAAAQLNA